MSVHPKDIPDELRRDIMHVIAGMMVAENGGDIKECADELADLIGETIDWDTYENDDYEEPSEFQRFFDA